MSTRFILVRHGETAASIERRFAGSTDVELTAHGHEQASALARRLAGAHIDVMHVSPLTRCRQTAAAISEVTGLVATITEDIRECSFGEWENLTITEVLEGWTQAAQAWLADESAAPPGGESWADLGVRVERWFRETGEEHAGRTILGVMHGGPIISLARHLTNAPREALGVFMIDTASVSIIQVADGRRRIRAWNDTTHLVDPLHDGGSWGQSYARSEEPSGRPRREEALAEEGRDSTGQDAG